MLEELAGKTNSLKAKALVHNLKSIYFIHKRKLNDAINEHQSALEIAQNLDDNILRSKIYTVGAMAHNALNNLERSIQAVLFTFIMIIWN